MNIEYAKRNIQRMQERLDWLQTHQPDAIQVNNSAGRYWVNTATRIENLLESISEWTSFVEEWEHHPPTQGTTRVEPTLWLCEDDVSSWICAACETPTYTSQHPGKCEDCGHTEFHHEPRHPYERQWRGHTLVFCCGDWVTCDGFEVSCASGEHYYTYGGQSVMGRQQMCRHQWNGGDCDCGSDY